MTTQSWGLAAPATLPSTRRTRALGIAAAVRYFNDRAVPGLGGIWYVRQVLNALLGVAVANELAGQGRSPTPIQAANAIEALACMLGYRSNESQSTPRLRGRLKLSGQDPKAVSFEMAARKSFYVTQPMRTATVQALPQLGFVRARNDARFNTFELTEAGEDWLALALKGHRPGNGTVVRYLTHWASSNDVKRKGLSTLTAALSPLAPLSTDALKAFQGQLLKGSGFELTNDRQRRDDAYRWIDDIRCGRYQNVGTSRRPAMLTEPHWNDIKAGMHFFALREAAIAALDSAETVMCATKSNILKLGADLPENVIFRLEKVKAAASRFLEIPGERKDAADFARATSNDDLAAVLGFLAKRDDHVLRMRGDVIEGGSAFGIRPQRASDDAPQAIPDINDAYPALPHGVSRRLIALLWLNLDVHGMGQGAFPNTNDSRVAA